MSYIRLLGELLREHKPFPQPPQVLLRLSNCVENDQVLLWDIPHPVFLPFSSLKFLFFSSCVPQKPHFFARYLRLGPDYDTGKGKKLSQAVECGQFVKAKKRLT
ncbi:MAG: hypothetical protein NC319_07545 [Butyricicoccus sp.]|nr:hypothetical protein [Butyricicoccus sp.]